MGNKCTAFNKEIDNENLDLSSNQKHNNSNDNNSSTHFCSIKSSTKKEYIPRNHLYTLPLNLEFPLNQGYHISKYINLKATLINKSIKGYLLRKKYNDTLKTDLMDFTNELYFNFIDAIKNPKIAEILLYKEDKRNNKIKKYLGTSWTEFYEKDPAIDIKRKIKAKKRYMNSIIFKYKEKNFHSDDINKCIECVEYCYKGSVQLISNKKCGPGEKINIEGSQQIGDFYDDKFNGWNTYIDQDGVIYVGLFINNVLNGKGIKYIFENDHIYKGDFVNGLRNGYGKDYRKNYIRTFFQSAYNETPHRFGKFTSGVRRI